MNMKFTKTLSSADADAEHAPHVRSQNHRGACPCNRDADEKVEPPQVVRSKAKRSAGRR